MDMADNPFNIGYGEEEELDRPRLSMSRALNLDSDSGDDIFDAAGFIGDRNFQNPNDRNFMSYLFEGLADAGMVGDSFRRAREGKVKRIDFRNKQLKDAINMLPEDDQKIMALSEAGFFGNDPKTSESARQLALKMRNKRLLKETDEEEKLKFNKEERKATLARFKREELKGESDLVIARKKHFDSYSNYKTPFNLERLQSDFKRMGFSLPTEDEIKSIKLAREDREYRDILKLGKKSIKKFKSPRQITDFIRSSTYGNVSDEKLREIAGILNDLRGEKQQGKIFELTESRESEIFGQGPRFSYMKDLGLNEKQSQLYNDLITKHDPDHLLKLVANENAEHKDRRTREVYETAMRLVAKLGRRKEAARTNKRRHYEKRDSKGRLVNPRIGDTWKGPDYSLLMNRLFDMSKDDTSLKMMFERAAKFENNELRKQKIKINDRHDEVLKQINELDKTADKGPADSNKLLGLWEQMHGILLQQGNDEKAENVRFAKKRIGELQEEVFNLGKIPHAKDFFKFQAEVERLKRIGGRGEKHTLELARTIKERNKARDLMYKALRKNALSRSQVSQAKEGLGESGSQDFKRASLGNVEPVKEKLPPLRWDIPTVLYDSNPNIFIPENFHTDVYSSKEKRSSISKSLNVNNIGGKDFQTVAAYILVVPPNDGKEYQDKLKKFNEEFEKLDSRKQEIFTKFSEALSKSKEDYLKDIDPESLMSRAKQNRGVIGQTDFWFSRNERDPNNPRELKDILHRLNYTGQGI